MISMAKLIIRLRDLGLAALLTSAAGVQAAESCPALLRHTFNNLQGGTPQNLCQFQGKVILVVNTASYCGNTDQYAGLEALYRREKARGLVVLGFPSNDFGKQEPGSHAQIAEFCRSTYGVEFPMFEKTRVVGDRRNSFHAELARRTGQSPRWNFHKYLIDRSGTQVRSYDASRQPDDPELSRQIRDWLGQALSGNGPRRAT